MTAMSFNTPAPTPATLLLGLLDRLEDAIEQESEALRHRLPLDFDEMNRRKSRSLLELSRAARALPAALDGSALERLANLRGKLLRNQELLALHLAAAQEVASILGTALRDAESDGTYSISLATRYGA
ncbi:hypothetical protein AncyloWKF20_12165 [Ancylobacter sp. WKF20]|uniref:hypothetical protein n=1 Tax=Ancylobacter sp. WKF20 TaxID=3039801 RepID=UPI0024341041|nr:hypothetical protein [Ancylobacter sp. WKF20]WGD28568.1 hypothetical protein AncyloWKF20_12165 [Ancylobacter sp. WKF20]